jgi:hypothetical protein
VPTPSVLPLYAEPPPPVLMQQSAMAQDGDGLDAVAGWRYRLNYWHPHLAQDEVIVTASFNTAMPDDLADSAETEPPQYSTSFTAQLLYDEDGEWIRALRLTCEAEEQTEDLHWPQAEYQASGGEVISLGRGAGEGAMRTYAFEADVPYEGAPIIGLCWDALRLNVARDGRAALTAVRNRGLVPSSPSAAVRVYRTATVLADVPVVPLIRRTQEIDISPFGGTVGAALEAAFALWLSGGPDTQRVTVNAQYGAHVDGAAGPTVYWPVGVYENLCLEATTGARIAASLEEWKTSTASMTTGGHWLFSLQLFAKRNEGRDVPLLNLERLVYPLTHDSAGEVGAAQTDAKTSG